MKPLSLLKHFSLALALVSCANLSMAATFQYLVPASGLKASAVPALPGELPVEAYLGDGVSRVGACTEAPLNCAVLDAAAHGPGVSITGGLAFANVTQQGFERARANLGKATGKWYWEVTGGTYNGVQTQTAGFSEHADSRSWVYGAFNGATWIRNFYTTQPILPGNTGHNSTAVVGYALDMDAGTLTVMTDAGSITLTGPEGVVYPMVSANSVSGTANFGQSNFAYRVPVGYHRGVW